MTHLQALSSQAGARDKTANRKMAELCRTNPNLLVEIVKGLESPQAALTGDCAEVLTMVAEHHPELVAPYVKHLAALLPHRATRVRWEAMHALAHVAASTPRTTSLLLPQLQEIMRSDGSTIVRDYAVEAVANYAGTGKSAAEKAYPILKEALMLWHGKHAGRALTGLANIAAFVPRLHVELHGIGSTHLTSARGVVRQAAKKLVKATEPDVVGGG